MKLLSLGVVLVALLSAESGIAADKHTFKVATLAPEGSTWHKVFQELDRQLKARSDGRLRIKLYAGGVAGDEPDVVRKMRIGSLHGSALTSVGLAEIQPALLALQAPRLFHSWDELDATRQKLAAELSGLLAEKGYAVLMWGDVGFNRFFSNTPVRTPQDLKNTKMWVWTQDGVYRAVFSTAGVQAVPLGVPQVLPSLQTGLIDAFSTSPLAAVALQWFSRAKYMLDLPFSVTIGAVVMSEKSLSKLSAEDRALLMQVAGEMQTKLAQKVRADNERAQQALEKAGVTVIKPAAKDMPAWEELAKKSADAAAGTVYPKELLAAIRQAVAEQRK